MRSNFILLKVWIFIILAFIPNLIRSDLKETRYLKKTNFQIKRWPHSTFNDLWGYTSFPEKFVSSQSYCYLNFIKLQIMTNLRLYHVSIHTNKRDYKKKRYLRKSKFLNKKLTLCDLQWPLRLFFKKQTNFVFILLASI